MRPGAAQLSLCVLTHEDDWGSKWWSKRKREATMKVPVMLMSLSFTSGHHLPADPKGPVCSLWDPAPTASVMHHSPKALQTNDWQSEHLVRVQGACNGALWSFQEAGGDAGKSPTWPGLWALSSSLYANDSMMCWFVTTWPISRELFARSSAGASWWPGRLLKAAGGRQDHSCPITSAPPSGLGHQLFLPSTCHNPDKGSYLVWKYN